MDNDPLDFLLEMANWILLFILICMACLGSLGVVDFSYWPCMPVILLLYAIVALLRKVKTGKGPFENWLISGDEAHDLVCPLPSGWGWLFNVLKCNQMCRIMWITSHNNIDTGNHPTCILARLHMRSGIRCIYDVDWLWETEKMFDPPENPDE